MKKHLFAPAAAAMLVFAACSSEEVPVPVGDDGSVTFEVSLPAALGSRYGEGSVIKQLHYAVYDANNPTIGAIFASDVPGSPAAKNSTIDFTLKLNLVKGKTYDFIFWADAVGNDFYKFSSENKNVEITYTSAKGNDENRDAFFQAVKGVDVKGAMTMPVELRRPFAQLNFGTDDIEEAATAKTVIKSTAVKVKGVYTKLDLYGGIASDPTTVTFTSEVLPKDQTFPIDGDYDYLTMDYLLTGIELEGEGPDADVQSAKREMMEATLTFTFDDGQTADVPVPNMPVQRNYRTNVFGSLITSPMNLDIVVKPGFNEPPYNEEQGTAKVSTADELTAALAEGGDIKLGADITIPSGGLTVAKATTLDLNGQKIALENAADVIVVNDELTISDSGQGGIITSAPDADATIKVANGGKLIVDGGNILNPTVMSEEGGWGSADVLDIMQGATIIVNGGTIGSTEHYSSAINCQGGKVMISGGSFLTSGYSDYSPVKMSAGADMTIDGGTFGFEGMGASVFTIGSDVTLTINGGEFLCGGVWHLPDYVYEAIKKEDPTYTDEDIAEEKEFMATNRPIGVFQITGGNNNITISAGRFYGKYTAMDNGWNLSVNTLKQYLHISGGEWETSDIESYR